MPNMAALERFLEMMTSRMIVNTKIRSLERKIPRRKAKFTVVKSNVASDMKTREGREYFPTNTLRPLAASGGKMLATPEIQPRTMVRKT